MIPGMAHASGVFAEKRRSDRRTWARFAAITSLLVLLLATGPTAAEATPGPPGPQHIPTDVAAALVGRSTDASVVVQDLSTGQAYGVNADRVYDSASIAKVSIMASVLRRAANAHRYLTRTESSLLRRMITVSDNAAADALWTSTGGSAGAATFLREAGMTSTTAGPGMLWGLTRTTARDQAHLIAELATSSALLPDRSRAYALTLMSQVTPSQRWGVSAGPGPGTSVQLKNGWLPRNTFGWRINSIGHVSGRGRNYAIAILSQNNPSMPDGITTAESISRVIWRDLAP